MKDQPKINVFHFKQLVKRAILASRLSGASAWGGLIKEFPSEIDVDPFHEATQDFIQTVCTTHHRTAQSGSNGNRKRRSAFTAE